jgi:hypothetical protein
MAAVPPSPDMSPLQVVTTSHGFPQQGFAHDPFSLGLQSLPDDIGSGDFDASQAGLKPQSLQNYFALTAAPPPNDFYYPALLGRQQQDGLAMSSGEVKPKPQQQQQQQEQQQEQQQRQQQQQHRNMSQSPSDHEPTSSTDLKPTPRDNDTDTEVKISGSSVATSNSKKRSSTDPIDYPRRRATIAVMTPPVLFGSYLFLLLSIVVVKISTYGAVLTGCPLVRDLSIAKVKMRRSPSKVSFVHRAQCPLRVSRARGQVGCWRQAHSRTSEPDRVASSEQWKHSSW